MSSFSKLVLSHFDNPYGALPDAVANNFDFVVEVGNVHLGQVVNLYLKLCDNVIRQLAFRAYGGVVVIAAASYLCQKLSGATLEQAATINLDDLQQQLQLENKDKMAANLVLTAWQQLLQQSQVKGEQLCNSKT